MSYAHACIVQQTMLHDLTTDAACITTDAACITTDAACVTTDPACQPSGCVTH